MAVNTVKVFHGFSLYIGSGGASPSRITSGGTKVGNIISVGGEFGVMAKESVSEPLDRTSVRIAKGIIDYGTVEFELERDDDDAGQIAALAAAKHASNQYPLYIGDGTSTISFIGYVLSWSNPGGSGGDFVKAKMSVRLTAEPS